ncbi:MAG TPA: hypothetical protein VFG12_07170 [Rhodopila sp.]|nr:hypothetical protein [Rhodopila sp.]
MGPCRIALLLTLAVGQARAQPAERIFVPPPVQWGHAMLTFRPALAQTARDFAALTGGITFGMSPRQVKALLPAVDPNLSWNDLPAANEYPGDVRYLGLPIDQAGALVPALGGCPGRGSYVVLLFTDKGLFRLSYRLLADTACPDTDQAARAIFARYVPIGQEVALSTRYRTGAAEVVDVTDPIAGYLIPTRWQQVAH